MQMCFVRIAHIVKLIHRADHWYCFLRYPCNAMLCRAEKDAKWMVKTVHKYRIRFLNLKIEAKWHAALLSKIGRAAVHFTCPNNVVRREEEWDQRKMWCCGSFIRPQWPDPWSLFSHFLLGALTMGALARLPTTLRRNRSFGECQRQLAAWQSCTFLATLTVPTRKRGQVIKQAW